ncbi:MAG: hypothetical protein WCO09_03135 [bacterium]
MFILYTICGLSLLILVAMMVTKMLELSGKKSHIKFSKPEWDWHILRKYHLVKHNVVHIKRESLANFFHRMAKVLELLFIRLANKLEKRFSKLGDMIRGKQVARNKGSVSFFLKNIEDHKNNL